MKDNSNLQGSCQSQSAAQKLGVIYKITCLINGKIYVGKTKQKLEKRMYQHKYDAQNGSIGLGAAIAKYGWENFTAEVIEECPVELLNEREIFWIDELNSKAPNGYNLTDGGEGLVNPTDETRAKMSANHPDVTGEKNPNYGKKTPPEVVAKISAGNKGKPATFKGKKHTRESRDKISANHADVSGEKNPNYGKKTPPEVCAKISAANSGENNPNYGKKRPPEVCAKISASNKGRPSPLKGKKRPPEVVAKIKATWARKKLEKNSGAKKGRKHTPEEIAKISAANKGKPSLLKGKKRPPEVVAKIKATWARKKLEKKNKQ